MTFAEFQDYYTNNPVTFYGVYINQCMALMHAYIYEVLGLTDKLILAQPSAYEVFTNYNTDVGKQYFQLIANEPTNSPLPGDIICLGQNINPDGHVELCVSADVNTVTAFGANWNDGKADDGTNVGAKTGRENPHVYTHGYKNAQGNDIVLGWLHPIPQAPQVNVTDIQKQLKNELDAVDQCQTQLKVANDHVSQLMEELTILQNKDNDLQSKYATLEKENIALTSEIASFTTDRLDYAAKAKQSAEEASQLTEYLDTIAAHIGVDIKNQTDDKITSSILLAVSEQEKQVSDLQNQLKPLLATKNKLVKTLTQLPTLPKTNIFSTIGKYLLGLIIVQD